MSHLKLKRGKFRGGGNVEEGGVCNSTTRLAIVYAPSQTFLALGTHKSGIVHKENFIENLLKYKETVLTLIQYACGVLHI